ncbi:MAG: PHP domain-containing protein [Chloroflexota bacterium]
MNERDTAVSTHLHVHSHYSLLEGIASPQELAARAAADGMAALALTDSNNLYGAVAFAKACRAAGLQAITGMTVHIAPPPEEMPDDLPQPGRLTLLALGPEGYQSLCRLSARLQAYPEREVRLQRGLSWDDLKTYHDGLICIEAGLAGWLARFLRVGQRKAASRYAGRLGAIFPDRCYVGLELYGSQDATLAREMAQIGERFGMAPVVAQPVFALEAEDLALRPLLTAMSNNSRLGDVG